MKTLSFTVKTLVIGLIVLTFSNQLLAKGGDKSTKATSEKFVAKEKAEVQPTQPETDTNKPEALKDTPPNSGSNGNGVGNGHASGSSQGSEKGVGHGYDAGPGEGPGNGMAYGHRRTSSTEAPIDGGLSLLIGSGIALGLKRARNKRKKDNAN